MMLAAALLATTLAAAAQPACIADGAAVTGRFEWLSLTRPNGKPIPAPHVLLDIPVCVRTAEGVFNSGLLRIFPRDDAMLQGLHTGDALIVMGRYGVAEDFAKNGDLAVTDAQLVRQ